MNQNNVLCRIWAKEQDPTNGNAHRCHAGANGLKGDVYPRNDITRVLTEKPVMIERMEWILTACEPEHDGTVCKGCQYQGYQGLSHYYDH